MIDYKIASKALEIAITLTGADHTFLRTDERGLIIIKEPLFSTLKTVARAICSHGIIDVSGDCRVIPEDSINEWE